MKTLDINVYEAAQERLRTVFAEFDNIYVSFSGGKDSGLLLNLCLDYMQAHGISKPIAVMHQDFEAQYTATTEYVTRTLTAHPLRHLMRPYWLCLPMACKTATSQFEQYWYPWQEDKRELWTRPMPDYPCVIHLGNHTFDFYHDGITQEDIYRRFGDWYCRHECGGKGRTIGLIGIRAQESLNRRRAVNADKNTHEGLPWTTHNPDGTYTGYPLYDWRVEDVWTANARYGYNYNRIYDTFHYAGLTPAQMRVASPFNDWAVGALNLYRVIEPDLWAKFLGRVRGANFSAIYGNSKAVAWKHIDLPPGHTWQSFVAFLLDTLPPETRKTYQEKFATSIKFWRDKGGVLSDSTIEQLQAMGIKCRRSGKTSNYKTDKSPVIFDEYPDDAPVEDFAMVPSYKRMAICILKNDHLCKYMGFSQTKEEAARRKAAIEKYKNL